MIVARQMRCCSKLAQELAILCLRRYIALNGKADVLVDIVVLLAGGCGAPEYSRRESYSRETRSAGYQDHLGVHHTWHALAFRYRLLQRHSP